MNSLTKLLKKLPDVPPGIDEHPLWKQHEADVLRLTTAIQTARAEIDALSSEHASVKAATAEDAVADVLGDAHAAGRVAVGTRRVAELDQQLTVKRERLAIQEEAARRLAAKADALQDTIRGEVREAVGAAYQSLCAQLLEKLVALQPINDRLLALRARHADSAALQGAIWLDELQPRVIGGNANKMEAWLRQGSAGSRPPSTR